MLSVQTDRLEVPPLDEVRIVGAREGTLVVRDGLGREYARVAASDPAAIRVGGALGTHLVFREDASGRTIETASFRVNCRTELQDDGGRFRKLFDMLYYTMTRWGENDNVAMVDGKFYKYYVRWLRDHVHTLKGMKYFDADIKTAIELYADTQQPNGMIWDRTEEYTEDASWRDITFSYGGFVVRTGEAGVRRFERIPVENDVEYLFVEGLYYTWKATGDTAWMTGLVENAVRAFAYSTSDPYRWSEKYGLLKRGYTIDTWDFQSAEDSFMLGGGMCVDKDRTHFGVMHGDNTGFAIGCRYLAEMLRAAGRGEEAEKFAGLERLIRERLDAVAWNGEFYTHHLPEHPERKRDLGNTPEDRQVSLSNAYALNRGVTHEQAAAIVRTYQRLREEMPKTSPGEFYQIYPPFDKGFGGHNGLWHYMNGGVTTIVAGELAHGAFENGFEKYAVDILDRVRGWGEAHRGYLHCCLRGAMPEEPKRSFQPLDLRELANVDFRGGKLPSAIGWADEPGNDLAYMPTGRQTFHGVPFDVVDPAANGRRACIGLSSADPYLVTASVPVGRKAASLYFLHTVSGGSFPGWITVQFADGRHTTEYIRSGQQVGSWFMPTDPPEDHRRGPVCKVAWRGANDRFPNVGVYAYGMNVAYPDAEILSVTLTAAETDCRWLVLAVTACDAPVFFPPNDVSFGIPDNWGAGAVVYALVEGLMGIKDTGVAFDRALLAPRWAAAGVTKAEATVKYEASQGYVRYTYSLEDAGEGGDGGNGGRVLRLEIASNAERMDLEILLPEGSQAGGVTATVNGASASVRAKSVEVSQYACLSIEGIGAHTVELRLV
jgi:hypothetical protein